MRKTLLIFASMMLIATVGFTQTLSWQFNNYQVINAGSQLQFDVEVKADMAGTFHRDLQVYFDYNTAGFGTDIVSSMAVTVTPLDLMATHYSIVNMADNTSSKFAIITEANNEFDFAGSVDYFNEMPTTFTGLLRFTIDIIDNTALAGIDFDQDLMNGGQYYQSTSSTDPVKYGDPSLYMNDLASNRLSTLYGTITYANAGSTVLTGCNIDLLDGGTPVANTDNDVNGMYYFSGINDGTFTMETTCSNVWGGAAAINPIDVLIWSSFVATNNPPLSALKQKAGDVNNNGLNDPVDILLLRIFVATGTKVAAWSAPDYVFEDVTGTVTDGVGTVDYQGLCSGDVNGSYTPPVD